MKSLKRLIICVKRFIWSLIHHSKSSMDSWSKNEIEIACQRERGDSGTKKNEWDYGCACYQSAYKAYKSLLKDGHSGFSIGLTKNILNRMIDGKPLTPIEDIPEVWGGIDRDSGEGKYVTYQCNRMSALFKYVYSDGTIKYYDVDQSYSIDVETGTTYHGLAQRIISEMYPITMPYYPPTTPIKVYCGELLTDRKNGDFDSVAIFYLVKPDGERVEINRFFKSDEEDKDWIELTPEEYKQREAAASARIAAEEAEDHV